MSDNYTAKNITTLKGVEGIRMRPSMYIGDSGVGGMHHLLQEVISNSVDEFLNGYGDTIEIEINSKNNSVKIRDFGRGIPFGKNKENKETLIEIATKLHSGGKFNKKGEQGGYNVSGGLHGIGLTATNALSKEFQLISYRDGFSGSLTCEHGIVKSHSINKVSKEIESGTSIYFIPDEEIFNKIKWNYEVIKEKVQLMSYLTSGLKFILSYDEKKEIFLSEAGIRDLLESKIENPKTNVFYSYKKNKNGDTVEVAFAYTDEQRPFRYMAFTNNIPNVEGGTHVTGFKTAVTNSLNKLAKDFELIKKDDDNLSGEILQRGMIAVISFKMENTPQFKSQTKEKLLSPSARAATSTIVSQSIAAQISQRDLKFIIEKALREKKAEEAAKKARETANKIKKGGKKMNRMEMPGKLKDCRDRENGELYIVEGDSAGGNAKQACNSDFQAIMPLRGKVLNTMEKELDEAFENAEIQAIMNILGCGVGEHFKMSGLRYDKIVLLADADPDGAHINVLLMTLFLRFFPELIQAGKIYRAVPPLYKVERSRKQYFLYTAESLAKDIKRYGQPKNIQRYKGLGENSVEQLRDTVFDKENRVLIPLTTENIKKTIDLFQTLMGSNSSLKYEFIVNNSNLLGDDLNG